MTPVAPGVPLLAQHLRITDKAHDELREAAQAFDRVIGSWDVDCTFTDAQGGRSSIGGEWHFGWILAGRMLQDVLYFYPRGQRPTHMADWRGGTTLRLFDPKAGQWLVSWFAALRGEVIHLRGGAEGERIVLHGEDVDGARLRWSFNNITDRNFRWVGETSSDLGMTWRIEQEMQLRRMTPGRSL